jgi:hypothetical protein
MEPRVAELDSDIAIFLAQLPPILAKMLIK